jgi:Pyruvate-formate lyase
MNEWNGFRGDKWQKTVDVEDFIINNYKEYIYDEKFLVKSTKRTERVWSRCQKLIDKENITGVLDVETGIIAGIDNFEAGYIDKKSEIIYGLQTDEPLKRIVNPLSGIDNAVKALSSYGYQLDKEIKDTYSEYIKSYSVGITDAYTKEIEKYRSAGVLNGLPEEYGRGEILGDYRRLALYGADYLIAKKENDLKRLSGSMNFAMIRTREEVAEQIKALKEIKLMASRYGVDVSAPAATAREAVQWLYFAYLATVKQNNGVINSFGRNTAFIDIYIERDLEDGIIKESEAQELIDQLIIKLRLIRHLRKSDYKEYLIGDPTWVTESIGGMLDDERSFVTKTAYRFLNTIDNLGSSTEPNFTVLWAENLPATFKNYVSELAINTHVIQFVNDDLMMKKYGTDYAVTGSVSAVKLGREMIYYGASCNLVKALLYAINEGKDEITKEVMIKGIDPIEGDLLDYQTVVKNFVKVMSKIGVVYSEALNIIHYMQDKYAYESSQMAFLNTIVERKMILGIAGISTITDSLSAIRYSGVKVVRDEDGIVTEFMSEKDFPRYGNNDDRADKIAADIIKILARSISNNSFYRNSNGKLSLQTITDNISYGASTGSTPDGREYGNSLASGASPTHGYDIKGAKASLYSVAKIPYLESCEGGIANNFSITPNALGKKESDRIINFASLIDDYFNHGGQHLNINVLSKDKLLEAQRNPDKYPDLIVRLSGCAVRFNSLVRSQQEELINRTFHEVL